MRMILSHIIIAVNIDDFIKSLDEVYFGVCKKASRKLHGHEHLIHMNNFCNSQFSYCPFI